MPSWLVPSPENPSEREPTIGRPFHRHAAFRHIAEPNLILRATVGSTAHGLHLAGTDDRDEMGVCIEPPEYVIGLERFEQWIYRTAEDRAQHDPDADQRRHGRTPPSKSGDLDLVVYSLRKYARLAAAGNPTVLLLLYAEPLYATEVGHELRRRADLFASREAGHRFLGYLRAQKERLLGQRGQMRVTRTELIARHGYDTKFAMHALRLGYQGVEFLSTGRLTLPMQRSPRDACMEVRLGQWPLDRVVTEIRSVEQTLESLLESSPLPEKADYPAIDRFLVEAYDDHWDRGHAHRLAEDAGSG